MLRPGRPIILKRSIFLLVIMLITHRNTVFAQSGINDTLRTSAIVYNGDTIEYKYLSEVAVWGRYTGGNMSANAKWTRLRNAIYVTYPYALKAGAVMNDINTRLKGVEGRSSRRQIIRSREKELKKEFTDPLTNLSIYQGKVLMKLINRETGSNCYEIIKEYKGGLTARFYQTVAFFFSSNLKQPYDAQGDDQEIEKIVQEVCRVNGYPYSPNPRMMQEGN